MFKDNFSIRETKNLENPRNPVLMVVLLIALMQLVPVVIFSGYGYFLEANNPGILTNAVLLEAYFKGDKLIIIQLYLTLVVLLASLLFTKYYLHRSPASLGLVSRLKFKNYLKGIIVGTLMIGSVVLILWLTGAIKLSGPAQKLSVWTFIILGLGWIIQGFEEEFICRSIVMNRFAAMSGPDVGIVASSLIFTILHIRNPFFGFLPALNLFLVGVLFSLLFYVTDNIYVPAAAHSFWNFVMGNIFGIKVSGLPKIENTIFRTEFLGNDILTGGGFGLEGGLITSLVSLLVIGLLIKKAKSDGLLVPKDDR